MKKFLFLSLILIPFLLVSCPDQNGREIDVAPRIVLIGPSEVFFNVNDTYVEYGYIATDVDGNDVSSLVRRDISSLNMGKEGSYQVSYVAVDRKGVKSDPLFRTVNVGDAFAPQISISGANPLLIPLNSDFSPPSVSAFAYDGSDLSDSVSVDASSVDTSSVGTYLVSYSVSDSSGVSGSASLFVYVLESSNPRIVLDGPGSSEDNPFSMQVQGSSASDENIKAYIESTLPLFQAYDLEDGDISYKVALTAEAENSLVTALKTDSAGSVTAYELTVSDSENNTGTAQFWILPQTDTEPPVLTIAGEQPSNGMYQIEVDMWNNNSSAWTDLFTRMQIQVSDNSWSEGTAQTLTSTSSPFIIFEDGSSIDGEDPSASDDSLSSNSNPITISISYISSNSDSSNDLITTLNHDKGADLNLFDYNNPTSQVNIKQVSISAKDAAGNPSAPLSISIQMTDSTPPVITSGTPKIPFATGSSGVAGYGLKWKDNSGLEGTCSGIEYKAIEEALVQGQFRVTFTAMDSAGNRSQKEGIVEVQAPAITNWVNNGSFGSSSYTTATAPTNLKATATVGWEILREGSYHYKRPSLSPGVISDLTQWDAGWGNRMIVGSVILSGKQASAYYTPGAVYVDGLIQNWYTNQKVAMYQERDVSLYKGVTYRLAFDIASFKNWYDDKVSTNFVDGGSRALTLKKVTGPGALNSGTDVKVSFAAGSTNSSKEGQPFEFLEAKSGNTTYASYKEAWQTLTADVPITGGSEGNPVAVSKIRLEYEITAPSDGADDYASLTTNIRLSRCRGRQKRMVIPTAPSER